MPLIKTTTQVISVASISPNGRTTATVFVDCTRAVQIAVTARVTYSLSAELPPAILEIYTSWDGTSNSLDSQPLYQEALPVQFGSGVDVTQMTRDVPASPNYVVVKVFNPSPSVAVGGVDVYVTVQSAT